ncbi:hypothetical protein [Singulisphaera sp. PoT]|uniref:hypothetical protein n=1 Tax=Singulisphaera sp. PoT TaxID=3411797 RepID=UPI003BF5065A
MRELRINRRAAFSALAGLGFAIGGCGGASTATPVDVKEGGGTPTLFDNPPLGDPLAPSQAELNSKRPAKKSVRRTR